MSCPSCGHWYSRSRKRTIKSPKLKLDYRECRKCGMRWVERRVIIKVQGHPKAVPDATASS